MCNRVMADNRTANSDSLIPLERIPYTVRISRRARRLQVRVTPFGDIEVVLPHRMHPRHVEPFVSHCRDWIRTTQAKLLAERLTAPLLHEPLPGQIDLRALDRQYEVSYHRAATGRRNRVVETADCLTVIAGSDRLASEQLRKWLSRQARASLVPWLSAVADELGLEYRKAVIRGQKTRWGSCSSNGTISLNRALLLVHSDVVRYLFIHELCHTVHMNHSRRFWNLVERHEPRFRHYEKQLNEATRLMPLWLRQQRLEAQPA